MIKGLCKYSQEDIKKAEAVRVASYGEKFVFELRWAAEYAWIYVVGGALKAKNGAEIKEILTEIRSINPNIEIEDYIWNPIIENSKAYGV